MDSREVVSSGWTLRATLSSVWLLVMGRITPALLIVERSLSSITYSRISNVGLPGSKLFTGNLGLRTRQMPGFTPRRTTQSTDGLSRANTRLTA
ncbi:hypothetical protein C8Q78DRAFT_217200 [Trametes maxima]|nr:hypothetical protein C8Q78DRAFT_217200 [Trametes maxima]